MKRQSLLLVEDDQRLCGELVAMLRSSGWATVSAGTGAGALASLGRAPADLVLLDLGLPDADGIALIPQLLRLQPDLPIVVLTVADTESRILAAFRAGARGYLLKEDLGHLLPAAIGEALAGGAPMSRAVARLVVEQLRAPPGSVAAADDRPIPVLSKREIEIIEQMARGLTYEQVAAVLAVSVNTVRSHIRTVYEKLSVNSRTEAVLVALRLGLF